MGSSHVEIRFPTEGVGAGQQLPGGSVCLESTPGARGLRAGLGAGLLSRWRPASRPWAGPGPPEASRLSVWMAVLSLRPHGLFLLCVPVPRSPLLPRTPGPALVTARRLGHPCTHPRLPHVVTLRGPGVGTPTKGSGGTEWCLHIVSTSCKLELLLFLSVVPTFSQVASTDTCPNCRGLPAPGGLPHTRRGPLGVRPGHVTPWGTRPRTPSLEGLPN